jgi:Glycolipid 2-alpha-mannosyltransferase
VSCPYLHQSRLSGLINPKNHSRVIKLTKSKVEFGLVPTEHWNQPQWINETKASSERQRLLKDGVAYGGDFAMFISCSVKLFFTESSLHREPFVRLSCSGSNLWILLIYNRRYRNMCRFFAGVMFPSRTLSSTKLDIQ